MENGTLVECKFFCYAGEEASPLFCPLPDSTPSQNSSFQSQLLLAVKYIANKR